MHSSFGGFVGFGRFGVLKKRVPFLGCVGYAGIGV